MTKKNASHANETEFSLIFGGSKMNLLIFKSAVAFFILQSFIALGQTAQSGASKIDADAMIRQLEARRVQAMIQFNPTTLDSIFADDLTYTHTNGRVDSKQQLLAALQSGELKYEEINYLETNVRIYGEVAVVTGSAGMKVQAKSQTLGFNLRFMNVYVKQKGFWKMVAWQSTRLPE
jgi:hypothetical protein